MTSAHSNQIGKILSYDGGFLYYLSQSRGSFFKINTKTYQSFETNLSGTKAFQLTAVSGRVYVIDEDGGIEVAYPPGDNLGQPGKVSKKKDEEDDSLDEDEANQDSNAQYKRKLVRIEDIPDEVKETSEANNASIIAGSDAEDEEEEAIDEASTKDKDYLKNLLSIQNKPSSLRLPVSNCFYRTIAANESYVVAVAHDGRGNNSLYVYDSALNLLASRRVVIRKKDYSFNMSSTDSSRCLHPQDQACYEGPEVSHFCDFSNV